MAATGKNVARDERPLAVRMAHALDACSWQSLTPEVVAKAKLCVYDLVASALAYWDVARVLVLVSAVTFLLLVLVR